MSSCDWNRRIGLCCEQNSHDSAGGSTIVNSAHIRVIVTNETLDRHLSLFLSLFSFRPHVDVFLHVLFVVRTYTTSVRTIIYMHNFHRSTSTASLHNIK
jgi:hypothetical protein